MADQPVPTTDPSQAQAVQIPLQDFTIPTFPPEALTAEIRSLTLTSDINLSEYQSLLSSSFSPVPELPSSIESLTLELFTLGYPPGFLDQLATRLPNIKALTIFGQLVGGVDEKQKDDAESFFRKIGRGLREIHLIDAFGTKGFLEKVGAYLKPASAQNGPDSTKDGAGSKTGGLNLLEVSYTYRHGDEEFLTRIHAVDLFSLLQPSLIAASFNISPPPPRSEALEDNVNQEDPENLDAEGKPLTKRPEGVMVLHPTHTPALVDTLVKDWSGEQEGLKMLALTLFTLNTEQLGNVLEKHKGLMVLNASLSVDKVEGWKTELWETLEKSEGLEVVEIVVSPGLDFYLAATNAKALTRTLSRIFPSVDDMTALSKKCKRLRSFEMNILRTTSFGKAEWDKELPNADWKGGISEPEVQIPTQPNAEIPKEIKEHYEENSDGKNGKESEAVETAVAGPP